MKTSITFAVAVGMTLLLAACTSTSEPIQESHPEGGLVGVWILEENETDGIQVFARAASLSDNHLGYEFSEHGGLLVRKPGWCGTPPITWMDHEGVWNLIDDQLLDIRHAGRGSPQEYQLEIISLSHRRFVCRVKVDSGS
ncbi:MAG: hypothetical protein KAH56_07475 [Candidatus Krumholzibacteria bacterium]|nr:hypothetical protein [Candidatus Krumholzibacteria bacterium]